MTDAFQTLHPRAYFARFLERSEGLRPDGRKRTETRATKIVYGACSSADGSALCTVGRTAVLCGVRYELGTPKPERPSQGLIHVRVSLTGLCSAGTQPNAEELQAHQQSILAHHLHRLLETTADFDSLCVESGRAVYGLRCDVLVLDDDGSVLDASVLALVHALKDLNLPEEIVFDQDGVGRVVSDRTRKMVLTTDPVPLSFGMFEDALLTDPSAEEENVLDASFFCIVDARSGNCLALYKPKGPPLAFPLLKTCLEKCRGRALEVDDSKSAGKNM